MDIQDVLSRKIKELPDGPYVAGLSAVKSHIDAAIRHFVRGQSEPDETLFTDVIFRCNQAFEDSIKEAYRVLAGKDPQNVRPYDIEQFLASNNLLRKKVLDQFTSYRRDWRNPAAHDYTLDFDEDEALIATVSVTVFAIVLTDQIDGKIAFEAAASIAPTSILPPEERDAPLLELVTRKVRDFAGSFSDNAGPVESPPLHDYFRLEGALAGFLSSELSALPEVTVEQNKTLGRVEADVVVKRGFEQVVVDLRRTSAKFSNSTVAQRALNLAPHFLHEPDVVGVVLLVYATTNMEYEIAPYMGVFADAIRIVAPRDALRTD